MGTEEKYNKKLLAFFIVFFIIIAFLGVYGAEHYNAHDETVELEQYCKISGSDLIKDNSSTYVYYITWAGSPTGDAGSWAVYDFMHHNNYDISQNSSQLNLSQSMSNYEYNNTPGIVFNGTENYSGHYGKIYTIVVPVYLYGENLTSNTTISSGLTALKADVPASIYNEVKAYTTEAIVDGLSIPSDNISAIPHINSVTLITGPAGTYILNGYIVDPSDFLSGTTPMTPATVLNDVNDNKNDGGIKTGMEGLQSIIGDAT
jgi:hypothetical protein